MHYRGLCNPEACLIRNKVNSNRCHWKCSHSLRIETSQLTAAATRLSLVSRSIDLMASRYQQTFTMYSKLTNLVLTCVFICCSPQFSEANNEMVAANKRLDSQSIDRLEQQHFKIGFLAPWKNSFDDISALTSASALSMAFSTIQQDHILNSRFNFRY